jgi:hypothetical protein
MGDFTVDERAIAIGASLFAHVCVVRDRADSYAI